MSADEDRAAATTADVSRRFTTGRDSDYCLSIEDALAHYEAAGIPRTRRSVQRYCVNGALDSHRVETPFAEKFLVTPDSVDRHIAYIQEVRPVATVRGKSGPAATDVAVQNVHNSIPSVAVPSDDKQRQSPTTADVSRPMAADARINKMLESENQFLREQIAVKDKQIADQLERAHETNALVSGLQRLLAPLLSRAPDRDGDAHS